MLYFKIIVQSLKNKFPSFYTSLILLSLTSQARDALLNHFQPPLPKVNPPTKTLQGRMSALNFTEAI